MRGSWATFRLRRQYRPVTTTLSETVTGLHGALTRAYTRLICNKLATADCCLTTLTHSQSRSVRTTAATWPGSGREGPVERSESPAGRPPADHARRRRAGQGQLQDRLPGRQRGGRRLARLLERGSGRRSRSSTSDRTPAPASCAAPIAGRHRSGCCSKTSANPFSAAVQRAVEDVAVPRGVFVLSASLDEDPARERALAKQFGARHVDGLVLAPAGDDQSHLAASCGAGTAIVCVDRAGAATCRSTRCSPPTRSAPRRGCGTWRPRAPAHRLPRRPAHDHHRRGSGSPATATRCAAAASPLDPDPGRARHPRRGAADGAVTALLARPDPPTALFTAQNLITIGAVRALRRLGLEHAVALVGFDDFLLADLLSPGVTVVAQDAAGDRPDRRPSCCSPGSAAHPPARGAAGADHPDPARLRRDPAPA